MPPLQPPQIQHGEATDEMIDAAEGKENKSRLDELEITEQLRADFSFGGRPPGGSPESSESALIASIKVDVRRNQRVFLF